MNKYRIIKREFADGSAKYLIQYRNLFTWWVCYIEDPKTQVTIEFDSEELAVGHLEHILLLKQSKQLVKSTIIPVHYDTTPTTPPRPQ